LSEEEVFVACDVEAATVGEAAPPPGVVVLVVDWKADDDEKDEEALTASLARLLLA
jgi:hypothetical protein